MFRFFKQYDIDDKGIIRSKHSGKVIKTHVHKMFIHYSREQTYEKLYPQLKGGQRVMYVHHLQAFKKYHCLPTSFFIEHIDGDTLNNSFDNIRLLPKKKEDDL